MNKKKFTAWMIRDIYCKKSGEFTCHDCLFNGWCSDFYVSQPGKKTKRYLLILKEEE